MDKRIEDQMEYFSAKRGDRMDPVAIALRRLYLRHVLCPCMQEPICVGCQGDRAAIEKAWVYSEKLNDRT